MSSVYKGVFNWYGEVLTLYTTAKDAYQGKRALLAKLAKQVGRSGYSVRQYFGKLAPDNFKVTREE